MTFSSLGQHLLDFIFYTSWFLSPLVYSMVSCFLFPIFFTNQLYLCFYQPLSIRCWGAEGVSGEGEGYFETNYCQTHPPRLLSFPSWSGYGAQSWLCVDQLGKHKGSEVTF